MQHDATLLQEADIDRVEFNLLSPQEIVAASSLHVTDPVLYDKALPRAQGLNSTALGTVDARIRCATCGHRVDRCPGHPGHISLPVRLFHIGYLDTVLKTLRCVCFFCSHLLVSDTERVVLEKRALDKRFRFADTVSSLRVGQRCAHCDNAQPAYTKQPLGVSCEFSSKDRSTIHDRADAAMAARPFDATTVYHIFCGVSEQDCTLLGFDATRSRPENMVLSQLLVPPPILRPSIRASAGSSTRGQDDLTHKLQEILTASQRYSEAVEQKEPPDALLKHAQHLQLHVATYICNNVKGKKSMPTSHSGAVVRDLHSRLGGKNGRLRGNLNGKRVERSGRTVIAPGPMLDIDQVGVPQRLALAIETTVTVTAQNIAELTERVHRGPGRLDGAMRVVCTRDASRPSSREKHIDLSQCVRRSSLRLLYGWRVERPLADGDLVMFNRQPSLHKMSMMAHRVKILPPDVLTFNLPLACTTMYNADFDGDEMNLYSPIGLEAKAELSELMAVPQQMLSAQNNRPCFGLVQDSLIGVYLMTRRDTFFDRGQVMQLLMVCKWWCNHDAVDDAAAAAATTTDDDDDDDNSKTLPVPCVLRPRALWSGKQIFSLIMPRGVYVEKYTQGADKATTTLMRDDAEAFVVVRDSQLLCGSLNKDTMGRQHGGIVHTVALDVGFEAAARLLSDAQRITTQFLETRAFSIGIGDCVPDRRDVERVDEMTRRVRGRIEMIHNESKNLNVADRSLEPRLMKVLGRVLDHSARIVTSRLTPDNNSIVAAVTAGSKGSSINVSQILGCVGQQAVDGRRIAPTLGQRTLCTYTRKNKRPETRGFVTNSYIRGLTPEEFFFHAMAGREGLVDTAVKTATTGYIQRKLEKAMESATVNYDMTVRSGQFVCDWVYGGDNMDASWLEAVVLRDVALAADATRRKYQDMLARAEAEVAFNKNNNNNNNKTRKRVAAAATPAAVSRALETQLGRLVAWCTQARRMRVDCQSPRLDTKFYLPLNTARVLDRERNLAKTAATSHAMPAPPATSAKSAFYAALLECATLVDAFVASLPMLVGLRDPVFAQPAVLALSIDTLSNLNVGALAPFLVHTDVVAVVRSTLVDMQQRVRRAVVQPGEMVGSLAAESVGEPCTQLTLNTFHLAGVASKNVTLGVPRVKELINCSKNLKTPSCTVRPVAAIRHSRDAATRFARSLERVSLQHVLDASTIEYPLALSETERFYIDAFSVREYTRGALVLNIGKLKMARRDLLLDDVLEAVAEFGGPRLVVTGADHTAAGITGAAAASAATLSKDSVLVIVRIVNITSFPAAAACAQTSPTALEQIERATLLRLQQVLPAMVHVAGVPSIKGASVTSVAVTSCETAVAESNEFWIDTDGTSLARLVTMPQVDPYWTFSNDVHEVYELLGVEAASAVLFAEIKRVLSFDGTYVNDRHIVMVVRTITRGGYLMPISRHGINRLDTGALMRSSFEETVDVLYDAAAFSEVDRIAGVTEAIMVGKRARMGTGLCGVFDVGGDGGARPLQWTSAQQRGGGNDDNDDDLSTFGNSSNAHARNTFGPVCVSRSTWTPKTSRERFRNVDDGVTPMDTEWYVPVAHNTCGGAGNSRDDDHAKVASYAVDERAQNCHHYLPSSPTSQDLEWLNEDGDGEMTEWIATTANNTAEHSDTVAKITVSPFTYLLEDDACDRDAKLPTTTTTTPIEADSAETALLLQRIRDGALDCFFKND